MKLINICCCDGNGLCVVGWP